MEICDNLLCGLIGRKIEQLSDKIDHIPGIMASETVIMIRIHLHGRMMIVMEGADHHIAPSNVVTVKDSGIFNRDRCFYKRDKFQNGFPP